MTYRYIHEYSGDYNELVYLRARYYAPGMGRFLTRDTWEGNFNQPLSLNQWNYVNSNPISYTDPSGYSPNCEIKGTCGPDVTEWIKTEMSNHYNYGMEIKNKVTRMKALAVITAAITPCTDIFTFLSKVAIEPPFNQIVREFKFPKTNVPIGVTPLITPLFANAVVDLLGRVEYALYGLAVDYSNLEYKTTDPSCSTGSCVKGRADHPIVSFCGECRDASDFGNMMFGVGGAARGYSSTFVLASALFYNALSNDTTSGFIDGAGAIPGWMIGVGGYYRNRNTLCQIANTSTIGRDSVEQIRGCQACTGALTDRSNDPASSLRSLTGASTIEELQRRLNEKTDDWLGLPSP